jgi:hypothetical protein
LREDALDAADGALAAVEIGDGDQVPGGGQPVGLLAHVVAEPERVVHENTPGHGPGRPAVETGTARYAAWLDSWPLSGLVMMSPGY